MEQDCMEQHGNFMEQQIVKQIFTTDIYYSCDKNLHRDVYISPTLKNRVFKGNVGTHAIHQ